MNQIMSPYLWGANGQALDPTRYRQQISTAPIDSPMQGFAQMAQAGVDAWNQNREASGFPKAPGMFGGLYEIGAALTGNRWGGGLY